MCFQPFIWRTNETWQIAISELAVMYRTDELSLRYFVVLIRDGRGPLCVPGVEKMLIS